MNDLDLFSEPSREGGHLSGEQLGRRGQRSARRQQRRRRVNGRAAVLFALAFLVAVIGGGSLLGIAALDKYLNPPDYGGAGTGSATVQIREGDAVGTMATRLEQAKVVKSSRAFVKVAKKEPKASSIQPGFYRMRLHMSSKTALALLLDPKTRAGNQITFPEGLRVTKVLDQLAKKTGIPLKDFQKAAANPGALGLPPYAKGKLEGYLFPDQYNLNPNASARDVLKMMVDRFKAVAKEIDLEGRAKAAKMNPGTVVTMASLIQAESGRPSDMPKISRVILNRLQHKPTAMFLKFDSTTLYGLGKFGIVASSEDIKSPSLYNTYNHGGLPPGAIDNPGRKSIEAAFAPAKGTWLFFVTTDPGRKITEFTDNDKDFNKLRNKLNQYLKTHGGN